MWCDQYRYSMTLPGVSLGNRILIVIGTRPEAIKMLPLVRAFREDSRFDCIVVSTGQHQRLVEEVLGAAGIEPDISLNAVSPGMSLNGLFSAVMTAFERFVRSKYGDHSAAGFGAPSPGYPAATFVHGDTSSAAATALASFHLRIPVVHVEAGLRTSDTLSPFPEELNRQLISRIAAFHLAPTYRNEENLIREGVRHGKIFVTGNTAIDALLWASQLSVPYGDPALDDLETDTGTPVVVVTAHRRENWGAGLERIGTAVAQLAERYPDVRFIVPLHPNPTVAGVFRSLLNGRSNVDLIAPLAYREFARLLGRAAFAITDSGGIQEEAPTLGTPVLVVRETTERLEGVEAGTVELVGTDPDRIVRAASLLLDDPSELARRGARRNPYGDGRAAQRIVDACAYVAFGDQAPTPYGSGFNRVEILRAGGYQEDTTAPAPERASRLIEDMASD
jgi:UDP-N-acetylglucosamine 2-epimerase (non-hydrolysing)